MTTATTLAILAFCLGAVVIVVAMMRQYYDAWHIQKKYNAVCTKLKRYKAANRDCNAYYSVRRIECLEGHEHNGRWAVCRTSIQDGYMYHTCIKVFTDEDDEFNHREAQELVDKINE